MGTVKDSKLLNAELLERKWLTNRVLEIKLRRPHALDFLPGQFMRFHHAGLQRDYSIVSQPDENTLDFCVAIVEKGLYSKKLAEQKVGTVLRLSGPHGRFIRHHSQNRAVFVATGTGVAPFVSFCRADQARNAFLLHGAADFGQLIYMDLMEQSVDRYIPCLSQPSSSGKELYVGRVTDYLERVLAKGVYDFYLSGRRAMIRDATRIIDTRFEDSRLYIETYD